MNLAPAKPDSLASPGISDFDLMHRLKDLEAHLQSMIEPVIAFSGGLDSRFLAHVAARIGLSPVLLHVTGPHVSDAETAWAEEWAARNKLTLQRVALDPLVVPEVAAGRADRCYHCKRSMFVALRSFLETRRKASALPGETAVHLGEAVVQSGQSFTLCDGTNASDLHTIRPGLRALAELGVLSPLALAGIEKEDIRQLARFTGMERSDQRARPCLLTRFPYNMHVSRDALALLAKMETCAELVLGRVALTYAAKTGGNTGANTQATKTPIHSFVGLPPQTLPGGHDAPQTPSTYTSASGQRNQLCKGQCSTKNESNQHIKVHADDIPDFRIRLSEDGAFTLHTNLPEWQDNFAATQGLEQHVNAALSWAGLPAVTVLVTSAVSGYFDRQSKNTVPTSAASLSACETGRTNENTSPK